MIDPKEAAVGFVNEYLAQEIEILSMDEFLFERYDEMSDLETDDQDHVLQKAFEEAQRLLDLVLFKFQRSNHPSGGHGGTLQS